MGVRPIITMSAGWKSKVRVYFKIAAAGDEVIPPPR